MHKLKEMYRNSNNLDSFGSLFILRKREKNNDEDEDNIHTLYQLLTSA